MLDGKLQAWNLFWECTWKHCTSFSGVVGKHGTFSSCKEVRSWKSPKSHVFSEVRYSCSCKAGERESCSVSSSQILFILNNLNIWDETEVLWGQRSALKFTSPKAGMFKGRLTCWLWRLYGSFHHWSSFCFHGSTKDNAVAAASCYWKIDFWVWRKYLFNTVLAYRACFFRCRKCMGLWWVLAEMPDALKKLSLEQFSILKLVSGHCQW